MALATRVDVGAHTSSASSTAETSRSFMRASDPHVAADADVAAQRTQEGAAEEQVARQAGNEGRVECQRYEGDVCAESRHRGWISDHQQRKSDRGGDQAGHHTL